MDPQIRFRTFARTLSRVPCEGPIKGTLKTNNRYSIVYWHFEENTMSTTNNTTTTSAPDHDESVYIKQFNRQGLKNLIEAYQFLSDYNGIVAHTYTPMIYARPRLVTPPTDTEKKAVDRMLLREKEILGKIKRMVIEMEKSCAELSSELDVNGWAGGSWEAGWGNNGDAN